MSNSRFTLRRAFLPSLDNPQGDANHVQEYLNAQREKMQAAMKAEAQHQLEASHFSVRLQQLHAKYGQAGYWNLIIWFGGSFYAIGADAQAYMTAKDGVLSIECSTRLGETLIAVNAWLNGMEHFYKLELHGHD